MSFGHRIGSFFGSFLSMRIFSKWGFVNLFTAHRRLLYRRQGIDKSSSSPNAVCVYRDLQRILATLARQQIVAVFDF